MFNVWAFLEILLDSSLFIHFILFSFVVVFNVQIYWVQHKAHLLNIWDEQQYQYILTSISRSVSYLRFLWKNNNLKKTDKIISLFLWWVS